MTTIHTPPASTLSLPSDTEIDDPDMPISRPIYLIVATALKPSMGIGLKGELPWPALKKDMAFFRSVTSGGTGLGKRNAVIMGRKTWESIPRRFRPLRGRVNVVVTRDMGGFGEKDGEQVLAVGGLAEGLGLLEEQVGEVGNVFVIGGSQIYRAAVGEKWAGPLRVLQTLVRRAGGGEIECDTFFPLELEETAEVDSWRRASGEEVRGWVDGKTVPGGDGEWEADGESGMEIRVVGWEKTP
jgi:dihydrofolate reductase